MEFFEGFWVDVVDLLVFGEGGCTGLAAGKGHHEAKELGGGDADSGDVLGDGVGVFLAPQPETSDRPRGVVTWMAGLRQAQPDHVRLIFGIFK
ncbi:hypothetical protein [Lacihabitans soyangensis]|uniref:Uncharacterized protein n=1 Tax=Lacihabitans soyangensis TaxID=869394 RepID=A0AAE3H4T8_9BACT|nr:hypothetical protein [Lacihabitans soyangensis]MCP9764487.1 hypothetical protein [Lacihabitans soyangensis]